MSRPTVRGLTPARQRVLDAIAAHQAAHDYPPTVRELCLATGRTTRTVQTHLQRLCRDGLLTREPGKSRTVRLRA